MVETLGQKIKRLRKSKHLSLDKLAQLTKTSKSYLWEIEEGRTTNPSSTKLSCIAIHLDTTIGVLLGQEKESIISQEQLKKQYEAFQLGLKDGFIHEAHTLLLMLKRHKGTKKAQRIVEARIKHLESGKL